MREIKFRGKRPNGEWVVGDLNHYIDGHVDIVTYHDNVRACNCMVDPDTVGQFTGLKDKNGTEIYEGDIVKGVYKLSYMTEEVICIVRWDESGYWTFRGDRDFYGGYLSDLNDIEVIGNIHDNVDLLKGMIERTFKPTLFFPNIFS